MQFSVIMQHIETVAKMSVIPVVYWAAILLSYYNELKGELR